VYDCRHGIIWYSTKSSLKEVADLPRFSYGTSFQNPELSDKNAVSTCVHYLVLYGTQQYDVGA
jgi:hypothetical protein